MQYSFFGSMGYTRMLIAAVLSLIIIAAMIWAYKKWGRHLPSASSAKGYLPEKGTVLLAAGVLAIELALFLWGALPALFSYPWVLSNIFVAVLLVWLGAHFGEKDKRQYAGIGFIGIAVVIFAATHTRVHVESPRSGTEVATSSSSTSAGSKEDCPNFEPKRLELGSEFVSINPDHPKAHCDFVYKIIEGNIIKAGPDGTEVPDPKKTGTVSSMVITEVRALGDQAVIYYTLCPWGKAQNNGSPVCKS